MHVRAVCVLIVVDVFVCGVCVGSYLFAWCELGGGSGLELKPLLGSVREPKEKVLARCVCAQRAC